MDLTVCTQTRKKDQAKRIGLFVAVLNLTYILLDRIHGTVKQEFLEVQCFGAHESLENVIYVFELNRYSSFPYQSKDK